MNNSNIIMYTTEGGYVIGYGTNMPGDVKNSPAMAQAYEMGKNI